MRRWNGARRHVPLVWCGLDGLYLASVPRALGQEQVAVAAMLHVGREQGRPDDWTPQVRHVKDTVGGFALYQEVAEAPPACSNIFHSIQVKVNGYCGVCQSKKMP